MCKRGTAHPSWAMCGCQTRGVHSRDAGKDAGLAERGLEFETPFVTFMQAVAAQSRSWCLISINHEEGVEATHLGGAAGFRHTYEGQQNVLNGGVRVLVGLGRMLQQRAQKGFRCSEPRERHAAQPGTCSDHCVANEINSAGPAKWTERFDRDTSTSTMSLNSHRYGPSLHGKSPSRNEILVTHSALPLTPITSCVRI